MKDRLCKCAHFIGQCDFPDVIKKSARWFSFSCDLTIATCDLLQVVQGQIQPF